MVEHPFEHKVSHNLTFLKEWVTFTKVCGERWERWWIRHVGQHNERQSKACPIQRTAKPVSTGVWNHDTCSIMDSQETSVAKAFTGKKDGLYGKIIVFYLLIFSFLGMHKSSDKKHVSKV